MPHSTTVDHLLDSIEAADLNWRWRKTLRALAIAGDGVTVHELNRVAGWSSDGTPFAHLSAMVELGLVTAIDSRFGRKYAIARAVLDQHTQRFVLSPDAQAALAGLS